MRCCRDERKKRSIAWRKTIFITSVIITSLEMFRISEGTSHDELFEQRVLHSYIFLYKGENSNVIASYLVLLRILGKCQISACLTSWSCLFQSLNTRFQAHHCSMRSVLLWASRIGKMISSAASATSRTPLTTLHAYTVSQSQRVAANKPVLPISAMQNPAAP